MSQTDLAIRPAVAADADTLARLIDLAGEGIPSHFWQAAAVEGQAPLEVGRERAMRETGGFSFRNAFLAEVQGKPAGMLLGYLQPDPYDPGDLAELPPIVRPMVELEALAPGSWYVNALAVFPEHQGRGLGSALLDHAAHLARGLGAPELSLIVAEGNTRALGLYERRGYAVRARRPIFGFPDFAHAGDWVLMARASP